MGDTLIKTWWRGLSVDHIYENCPGRQRGLRELKAAGWDGPSNVCALDPKGTDVCGWCLRVWRARAAEAESREVAR